MRPTYSPACRAAVSELLKEGGSLTKYRANPKVGVGPEVGSYAYRLEREIETRFRVRHAVVCSSGTAALHVALLAIGIKAGDEVIVPAITFSASAAAIVLAGGRPVFADVDSATALADYPQLRKCITKKTKAIMPVHLFGNLVDLHHLTGIPIIEDACQAVGCHESGRYSGTFGLAGAYSFGSYKQVACGEGGAVVTNCGEVAEKVRLYINHAENFSNFVGYNYRLNEVSSCIALHGLWKLKDNTPFKSPYFVKRRGPDDQPYLDAPLSEMPAFKKYARGPLPVAEDLCKRSLCIQS